MTETLKNEPLNIEIKLEKWENITDKEKEVFAEYLKTKEKKEVIALTKEELETFRKLLNWRPNTEEELRRFVEKQEKETITASEIITESEVMEKMWWIEKFRDISSIINETLYKHFFEWGDSAFAGLEISEDAKRNFTTWANFFFINYVASELEKAKWVAKKVWDKWMEVMEESDNSFLAWLEMDNLTRKISASGELSELIEIGKNFLSWDLAESIKKVYNPEKEKLLKEVFGELNITDYEKEAIFMNPLEAHNFINFVYSENHSKDEIKAYIEERRKNGKVEFSKQDEYKLKWIWEKFLKGLTKWALDTLDTFNKMKKNFEWVKDGIKDAIKNNKEVASTLSFLTAIPVLWDFIKSILEFIGIKDLDSLLAWQNFEASKKVISENIVWKWSIFEEKKIPSDFMQVKWNNDNVFLNDINYLVWKKDSKDFGKWVSELFKKGGDFENFVKESKIWVLASDNINYERLKEVVSLYREFKTLQKENKNLDFKKFFEERENKKKINQKRQEIEEEGTILQQSLSQINEEVKEAEKQVKNTENPIEKQIAEQKYQRMISKGERIKQNLQSLEAQRLETLVSFWPEKLEVSEEKIEAVLKANWNFYNLTIKDWKLRVFGNKSEKTYLGKWIEWISKYLRNFKDLNKPAYASDFQEDNKKDNKGLFDKFKDSVKEKYSLDNSIEWILLNWYEEKLWLQQNFENYFFINWELKDKIDMDFNGKTYSFEKIS